MIGDNVSADLESLIKIALAVMFPDWRRDVYLDTLENGTVAQVNADPNTKQVTVRIAHNIEYYNLGDDHIREIALHEVSHIVEKMIASEEDVERRTHLIAEAIKRYSEYSAARVVLDNPQICKRCGHVSAVEFMALDPEWEEIADEYVDSVLCLNCYTELAAQRGMVPRVHIIPLWKQSLVNQDALVKLGHDLSESPNPQEWLRLVFERLDVEPLKRVMSVLEEALSNHENR